MRICPLAIDEGLLSEVCFDERLPIPPQRHMYLRFLKNSAPKRYRVFLEAPPRFELGVKVLQTRALPLGYGAIPACAK